MDNNHAQKQSTLKLVKEAFARERVSNPLPSLGAIRDDRFLSALESFKSQLMLRECSREAEYMGDLIEIARREPQFFRPIHVYGLIIDQWDWAYNYGVTYRILARMADMTKNDDLAFAFGEMADAHAKNKA